MALAYGREALRRLREQQEAAVREPMQPSLLEQIPPDAPMDDATITVWDGERSVAYEKWLARAPVVVECTPPDKAAIPADAGCVTGDCSLRVWLVRDVDRWSMFAGSRAAHARRKDFVSPYLEHAIRTAEQWYGVPSGGWRTETGRAGTGKAEHVEAAGNDLP